MVTQEISKGNAKLQKRNLRNYAAESFKKKGIHVIRLK